MHKKEKRIFIASTYASLDLARIIQQKINDYNFEGIAFNSKIWNEGDFFKIGQNGLSSLIKEIRNVDYAIILLTADDEITNPVTKVKRKIPRDNLLFELGLCYGILDEGNVLALVEKSMSSKDLLSDFAGITFIPFDKDHVATKDGTISSAVTKIIDTIKKQSNSGDLQGQYFRNKLIAWRKKRESDKYLEIKEGSWTIWLLKEDYYLRYIFGGVLSTLDKNDSYLTVSNLDFWASLGVDVDEFIQYNLDATDRGVVIKRVILLKSDIFMSKPKAPYQKVIIQTLIKIADRFKEKRKTKPRVFDRMNLYFLITEDYNTEMGTSPTPFAIVENKQEDDHALITPIIEQPINQVNISFRPITDRKDKPNSYDTLLKKFNRLYNNKARKSLAELDKFLDTFRKHS